MFFRCEGIVRHVPIIIRAGRHQICDEMQKYRTSLFENESS
jgi:hypothetical protein